MRSHKQDEITKKINEAFDMVGDYRPVSRDKPKEGNNLLYARLEREVLEN
jgi:hypothetical protein